MLKSVKAILLLMAAWGCAAQAAMQVERPTMPLFDTAAIPALARARVSHTLFNLRDRPFSAQTAEGYVAYYYEGNRLIGEVIAHGKVLGRYSYGRDGRFERIDYTDGMSIAATYGKAGELIALRAGPGRAIGFTYFEAPDGLISSVTPVVNGFEFHSAVGLLRKKDWKGWTRPAPRPDTAPHAGGEPGPAIVVAAPGYSRDQEPSADMRTDPMVVRASAHVLLDGPHRAGVQPGPVPGSAKDQHSAADRSEGAADNREEVDDLFYNIQIGCSGGPTPADRALCNARVLLLQEKFKARWAFGHYELDWLKKEPVVDFFHWHPRISPAGSSSRKVAGSPPASEILRVNPLSLHGTSMPIVGDRDEGKVYYRPDGDRLAEEIVVPSGVHGRYVYDANGRFERIEYTDGARVKAAYGAGGELLWLESETGKRVGFAYVEAGEGAAGTAGPTRHPLKFHSAVSLLRLKELPAWWPEPSVAGEGEAMPVVVVEGEPVKGDEWQSVIQDLQSQQNGIYIMTSGRAGRSASDAAGAGKH